jgi:hypothetical protein
MRQLGVGLQILTNQGHRFLAERHPVTERKFAQVGLRDEVLEENIDGDTRDTAVGNRELIKLVRRRLDK